MGGFIYAYSHCRTIYDNLSKVGDTESQETFKVRVQEIEPTIRFCNYNLSQGEDISGLRDSASQGGTSSDVLLQAKLDVRTTSSSPASRLFAACTHYHTFIVMRM